MQTITPEKLIRDGIINALLWDRVEGKERIYLETQKYNGGRDWNGGKGYSECYIDLNTRVLIAKGEAGARTRKALAPVFDSLVKEFGLSAQISR